MRKLLIIFLSALSLTVVAQKPKIAVYMTGDDPVNEIVSNRLVDDFARGNEYTTVERTASFLAELSKEHAYERSGEVDDEQIAALGRQFNVQYVCVVSVLDVWNTEKYITARIIDTETAEVVASCSSNGSIQNSSELIGALNTLSDSFFKAMRSTKQADAKKVAVYVSKTGNRDVDIVLGDQLVSGFAKSGRYVAIERTNSFLKKLKDEQGYQQSGAVADDDLTRWGQQFGVQYVCIAKSTSWAGDYFITTRMVDVKTGEVVNSYKIEGRKLANSRDVVRVAQEIASELSKGTLAEQAEEARLKREAEEARIRAAEEARLRAEAEERARIEAEERAKREEEERLEREKEEEIAYINSCKRQGYLIVETNDGKYMIDLNANNKYTSFKEVNRTYSKYGKYGWRLPYKYEMNPIVKALFHSRYGQLCKKHSMSTGLREKAKYWCVNGKNLRYYMEVYDFGAYDGPNDDYTFAFAADYYVKSGIDACAFYIIKL
ncbi:MAG: hypothetical protein IJ814_07805 [Paludibacteraceae bacterium]|nr:hypothetical protein [Paludibacteraceae bacterium]